MGTLKLARDVKSASDQMSFVMAFEPQDILLARRGVYTTAVMSGGAPRGEPGEPALPWRKFLVFIPDGAKPGRVSFELQQTVPLASDVLVEPIQPNVPIFTVEPVKPIGPKHEIYEHAATWPASVGRLTVVRRLGGKQLVEIELCPLQYHPLERRLELVTEIAVRIEIEDRPVLRKAQSAEQIQFEQRVLERIKARVVNPALVVSRLEIDPSLPFPIRVPHVPYVIVTTRDLARSFQKLAHWRTILGCNARVVTVESIRSNAVPDTAGAQFYLSAGYPDGGTRDPAEAIRNFIKWAHAHWQTEFVLLGGDTALVPARKGWMVLNTSSYGNLDTPATGANLIRSAMASSSAPGSDPANALDDDAATAWSCSPTDPAPWFVATLAGGTPLNHVQVTWGAQAPAAYKVQRSLDGVAWTDIYSTTSGTGGIVEVALHCTAARFVRLTVTGGTSFQLVAIKAFGPAANNTAYAISPTCTRIYLRSWITPNPTNSPDGDQLVIVDGARRGSVVPYDPASSDTVPGWHFVADLLSTPGTMTGGTTSFLEIRGPADWHGATFATKTSEDYIPTDLYYADLDSPDPAQHDWDADGNAVYGERYGGQIDGVNGMADVHIGRFPVTTAQQVDLIVDKVIRYERYRDASEFEPLLPSGFAHSALLASKNWFQPAAGYLDASAGCNEDIRHMLIGSGGDWRFTRLYEDRADVPAADVAPDLGDASQAAIKTAIAAGNSVVSLVSHGNPSYVCYLVPGDVDDEVSTPSIWYGNACSTNQFDGTAISEIAMLNQRGGAVAYVGNSRYGWTGDGPMERAFWEEMLHSGQLGPMLETAHQVGGDWQKYSLNLLGDPAMRVWSAAPRQLTVIHPPVINTGAGVTFTVTVHCDGAPLPSATVCASMNGVIAAFGTTNASGVVTLHTRIATAGNVVLAVSGNNAIPYVALVPALVGTPQIAVTPPSLSFGTVPMHRVVTRHLRIANPGTASLIVTLPAAPPASAFHWKALNGATIAPGSSLDHEVSFAPTHQGALTATLAISSNAGAIVQVPLTGTGCAVCRAGEVDYEPCTLPNGRPGHRKLTCVDGEWVRGPCEPGAVP